METKPKHFLLGTDLTSRSAVALRRVARLATEADGDITVLSVIEHGLPPKIVTRRMAEARAEIDADVAALTQPARKRVSVQVIEGEPFSAILGEAYRAFADMIVLGMHAKLGFPELFAGTTTERVLRFADRPVLLVSTEARGPYARIVAAVDRGENAARALAAAAALAPNAELHVIQAWRRVPVAISGAHEVAAAEEQRLRALLEQHVAKCLEGQQHRPSVPKLELVEGAAADIVRNAVERLGPDLLSLGANSRSGLAENFIGSTTREFLVHAPCDILVAH
ncbi:MAG TPA: universal stress protein, partial [Hyphomicrobiaceae bacterium]|nr:universal stress protein [Hyphomicrobiaceae bacterium]